MYSLLYDNSLIRSTHYYVRLLLAIITTSLGPNYGPNTNLTVLHYTVEQSQNIYIRS